MKAGVISICLQCWQGITTCTFSTGQFTDGSKEKKEEAICILLGLEGIRFVFLIRKVLSDE
jgi:hypothetical protein